jgi:cytochrome c
MTFSGIKNSQQRADLLAFLKQAIQPEQAGQQGAGMAGMMRGGDAHNLKKLDPQDRVQAIRHCNDTYRVTTADGKTREFWERNLRFKTDSSSEGPEKGMPAILGAGMQGDRASVIFSTPEERSPSASSSSRFSHSPKTCWSSGPLHGP